MGSSKTAQALITKFNYEERGMKVWLIKPEIDDRDGASIIRSRIGLEATAHVIRHDGNIYDEFKKQQGIDVVISDESQFFSAEQIDQMRRIVDDCDVPVLCYGLRTDCFTRVFSGSGRLLEIADTITEIKNMCECGNKAIVNARIDGDGKIVTTGEQVFIGGNSHYRPMCHKCWREKIKRQEAVR